MNSNKHFIDWEGLNFKEKESQYEKYHKKPETFLNNFVGPRNTWGGRRRGAGRPKTKKLEEKPLDLLTIGLKLNRIQILSLKEMGNGDIQAGVQALIDLHL